MAEPSFPGQPIATALVTWTFIISYSLAFSQLACINGFNAPDEHLTPPHLPSRTRRQARLPAAPFFGLVVVAATRGDALSAHMISHVALTHHVRMDRSSR